MRDVDKFQWILFVFLYTMTISFAAVLFTDPVDAVVSVMCFTVAYFALQAIKNTLAAMIVFNTLIWGDGVVCYIIKGFGNPGLIFTFVLVFVSTFLNIRVMCKKYPIKLKSILK